MRRGAMVVAAALAAVASSALPGASASGDATIVVRGTELPAGNRAQLTQVGCDSVFATTAEPINAMVGIKPGGGFGKRSLGFDPAGGSGVGLVSYVGSMATTTVAGMSVYAEGGSAGVAYAGYQAPKDVGTDLMWIGRAALGAPASTSWSAVDVPGLGYAWTQYDMSTRQPVTNGGSSGVAAFVRSHGGDGYGFYAVGFGCDGAGFNLDGWRIGSAGATTTYDFEGYRSSTTISGPTEPVEAGARVTLSGRVVDDRGAAVAGARAVLEEKQADGTWDTVEVSEGTQVEATVQVRETTTYRWKMFSTALVEGSTSDPFTVTVADQHPGKDPSDKPTDKPSDKPSDKPTDKPSDKPSARASDHPRAPTSAAPTQPAADPTPTPTPASTPEPSREATQAPAEPSSSPASSPAKPADRSTGPSESTTPATEAGEE